MEIDLLEKASGHDQVIQYYYLGKSMPGTISLLLITEQNS